MTMRSMARKEWRRCSQLGSHLHSPTGHQESDNSGFPLPTIHVLSPILLRIS